MLKAANQPGKLVSLRGRDWIVLPSVDPDLQVVKPLGGSDDEIGGIYLPLNIPADKPLESVFLPPGKDDFGDISTARLLYDSARLAFRKGAGPPLYQVLLILGLSLTHQLFTHFVTVKTTLSLCLLVHFYHSRIFAVADITVKGK